MIGSVFTKILSMSITASMIIIPILFIRLLLSRAPKVFSYLLWTVVLFRLVCPFAVYSELGIVPEKYERINIVKSETVSSISAGNGIEKINLMSSPEIIKTSSVVDFTDILGYIWFFTTISLILFNLITYYNLKKELDQSDILQDNVYLNGEIKSPFVFGILKPKIYLPTYLSDDEKSYVIFHEKTHIKRLDHITRILAFFALSIHWFNPLVWLSYRLSEIDMEMSCDESVISCFGSDIKKMYSKSLLSTTTGKRTLKASITLPFGSSDTKKRVQNILNYRKPTLIYSLVLLAIIGLSIICFGANNEKATSINLISNNTETKASNLYKFRTKYIGDNSKLGNIIYHLDFPEGFSYKGFMLKTSEEPFGLIIDFKMDSELAMERKNNMSNPLFYKNALLIFSLVENCDFVSYSIDTGEGSPQLIKYNIDWATKIIGENPWLKNKSEETFNDYYEYILSMQFVENTKNSKESIKAESSEEKVFRIYKDIDEVRHAYNNSELPSDVELGNRFYTDIYGDTRFTIIRVVSENGNTSDFTLYFDTRNNKIWTSLQYVSGPEYQYKDLIKLIDQDSFNSMFK